MGLVQVATNTVTSAVASVTLTGIDSDDVYMVQTVGVKSSNDNVELRIRVGTSGTLDSDSEYDYANKKLRADTTFQNFGYQNQDNWFAMQVGTSTQEQFNSIHYLYNFNNSSEFSFITNEIVGIDTGATCSGQQGGAVHTVSEANDSIGFLCSAGNIASGTFTLYKVI
tara:strand:- start:1711 stop:2214 length:504 start_codon:yes stop_codon:yes gene_type:complete